MTKIIQQLENLILDHKNKLNTPCYVYSVSQVRENYKALKDALGTQLIYSLKSNSNIDLVVRCGDVFDDGIEIASVNELNLIASGDTIKYVNNPSADKNFIRAAISSKATLVVDHFHQLKMLQEFVGKRPIAPIVLRLNASVLKHFYPEHANVRPDHFGMDWETASEAMELAKELDIQVAGFHCFKGSYSFNKTAMDSARSAIQIVQSMEEKLGYQLSLINLGGGFGPNWQQEAFDFDSYKALLSEFPEHIQIAHEAGRGIMGSAGAFVTRVRYTKTIRQNDGINHPFAICDGGIAQNFLLAQTENTFRKYQQPKLISPKNEHETLKQNCKLVGSSCSKDDVIGQIEQGHPMPQMGDLLVFENCGAYNASYTVAPFLRLPASSAYIIE